MSQAVTQDDFQAQVLDASEPVLVDFWADWCAPCKVLDPILDDLSGPLAGRLKIVKVDAADQTALAVRYNVRNLPTMIVFKNGEPADIKVGTQSRVALTKWIESHAA